MEQGKLDEAVAEYREAIRLKPDHRRGPQQPRHSPWRTRGSWTRRRRIPRGDPAQARSTPRPTTTSASPWRARGSWTRRSPNSARRSGSSPTTPRPTTTSAASLPPGEAGRGRSPSYREAIRLAARPRGGPLQPRACPQGAGGHAGSLAEFRHGHELGSKRPGWPYPSARWVAEAERPSAIGRRLPAVLKGDDNARRTPPSAWPSPRCCYDTGRFAAAARLWAEALAADAEARRRPPGRAPLQRRLRRRPGRRRPGEGRPAARRRRSGPSSRRQALDWLRAEHTTWSKLLGSTPPGDRPAVVQDLEHWQQDPDLGGIATPRRSPRYPRTSRRTGAPCGRTSMPC